LNPETPETLKPLLLLLLLQAMILNGSLQVASALLMLGLACWTRGWLCCGNSIKRSKQQQQQQREKPGCLEAGELAAGDAAADATRPGSQALLGGAVLAACVPEEEPPGTVPDLAVELSAVSLRRKAQLPTQQKDAC
jgi:hypothetical protein